MARYECPQCGRGFGSVSDMLEHTEKVHAGETVAADAGSQPVISARTMPTGSPGPVASERASQSGFEVPPAGRAGPDPISRPTGKPQEAEDEEEKQNPTLGTLIALIVIAVIVILNIIGGAGGD
ncbi:MAG TPA: C2H2-type zinc finger protein [Solirubrobacterales bacterium]|nr:C2H2-type zinc finger protein [Solirubrobacterales bacterium]